MRMAFLILSDLPVLSHFYLNIDAGRRFKLRQKLSVDLALDI